MEDKILTVRLEKTEGVYGPTIQGEGINAGMPVTFIRIYGCDFRCRWCLVPDTMVTMADFSKKPIKNIEVGDEILGRTKGGHINSSIVLATSKRYTNSFMEVACGIYANTCTPEHEFKTSYFGANHVRHDGAYLPAAKLIDTKKHGELYPIEPTLPDTKEYLYGYLLGAIKGDGSIWKNSKNSFCMGFEVKDKDFFDAFLKAFNTIFPGCNGRVRTKQQIKQQISLIHEFRWATPQELIQKFKRDLDSCYPLDNIDYLASDSLLCNKEIARGFLAGFFDAEGSASNTKQLSISQQDTKLLGFLARILEEQHFKTSIIHSPDANCSNLGILGSGYERLRFFIYHNPKILRKWAFNNFPWKANVLHDKIKSKYIKHKGWVHDITTSTGNFIANNMLVHNCDTPFSLGKDKGGEYEEVDEWEVLKRVEAIDCKNIVLSGGNPLIYQRKMDSVIEALSRKNYWIQVETQGSITPTDIMTINVDFWSISPKLPSAGKVESENWKAVQYFIDMANPGETQLKFVVANREDYDFLKERINTLQIVDFIPIVIQPEGLQLEQGFDIEKYFDKMKQLINWVNQDYDFWLTYDIRVLPQLHKLLWKKSGGV